MCFVHCVLRRCVHRSLVYRCCSLARALDAERAAAAGAAAAQAALLSALLSAANGRCQVQWQWPAASAAAPFVCVEPLIRASRCVSWSLVGWLVTFLGPYWWILCVRACVLLLLLCLCS